MPEAVPRELLGLIGQNPGKIPLFYIVGLPAAATAVAWVA